MRKKNIILIICLVLSSTSLLAQGLVEIHQDYLLNSELEKPQPEATSEIKKEDNFIKSKGYRVQIYSSNNARKAKEEAFELQEKLTQAFPDYKCYISYNAPFWKVRLGDFTEYNTAITFSKHLKSVLEDYRKQILVVEQQVRPIYFESATTTQSSTTQQTQANKL